MNINMYIHQNVIVQIFFGLKCIIIFFKDFCNCVFKMFWLQQTTHNRTCIFLSRGFFFYRLNKKCFDSAQVGLPLKLKSSVITTNHEDIWKKPKQILSWRFC